MKRLVLGPLLAAFLSGVPLGAVVNVPLTVQEAIYPGSVAGIARNADPVTVGVPLPDDPVNGVTDVSQLTLSGTTAGQFRVIGRWPSGRIKWVLLDALATLNAGGTANIVLTSGGAGNFGGSNLAVDNGSTITVSTGAATFTIRKDHFNVFDTVVVGGKTIVASGASQGFVLTGPAPGQTTCPPCATVYNSANDPHSTAVIEENGPVRTVIKADGNHVDSKGNEYMHFTVRMYFYKGKTYAKVTSVLRNADYGASNSVATAYKGHQGYELRLSPTIDGPASYNIATHTTTPSSGTLAASDTVYLYQGESLQMKWQDWCGWGCVPFTTDKGYQIVRNGTALGTYTNSQYPQGWADVSGANGAGVEIGVYQMSAYWPKSLELNEGGRDVRIGIWPRQNSSPYYQNWPQYSIHDLYVNFHGAPLAAPANDFLKFQHYLLARASVAYYNSTAVFPYPLNEPAAENAFYQATGAQATPATISASKACCVQDYGTADIANWPLSIYRYYAWHSSGGANQTEFRWSGLLNFLSRGWAGRYLDAAHFYRFQSESAWPRSDGFMWRDKTGEIDGFGFPKAVSLNASMAMLNSQNWLDQEHGHWYGMTDFYFLTGDETIHDALLDGTKDYFLNKNTYQNGVAGGLYNTRSVGINLIGAARFSQFLAATEDSDAPAVLSLGTTDFEVQVKPDLCVSGYPAGCVLGPVDGGPWKTQGVSRTRGIPWGAAGTSGSWCGVFHAYRGTSSFQASILIQGLLEFRNVAGPGWPDYDLAADLAYGIAQWNLTEDFVDNGSGRWDVNGFRFGLAMDVPNNCTNPGETAEPDFQPTPTQTTAMTFWGKYLTDGSTDWATKFKINTQKDMAALGTSTSDFSSYQLAAVINILNNPTNVILVSTPVSGFVDNGGGSYTISWSVPANAQRYRVKWGTKQIVDWVGFDPGNNVFTGDPARNMPWFAANNATEIPNPSAVGSTQSMTIAAGVTGLTAANFSIKTYVAGGSSSTGPAAALTLVSGAGQSGTTGQALAAPFTVKVSDAAGNAVAGTLVTFAMTGGAGLLSATQVTTNTQGLASTLLTLGPSAGPNTVTASSAGLSGSPVTFTAKGILPSGTAQNLVLVSGHNQSGSPGQALPNPLVVKATDVGGAGVSGVAVTFTVAGGGGSLSATQVLTDAQGQASSILTLGPAAGVNTVKATSGALNGSPITFTATGTGAVATPRNLVLVSGNNQIGATGQALTNPMVVKVTDAEGAGISGVAVTFAVTAGGGSLSATQVLTDAQGQASIVLTLGPMVGTNTVTASSGTLTGSPVIFTATGATAAPSTAGAVSWTKQAITAGWPGANGYLTLWFDPVSKQTLLYGILSKSTAIYSTDLFAYDAVTNTFTHINGTGSLSNTCPVDTLTQPGDRHPVWQMAIDTKRNVLWMYGGANGRCADPSGPNANPRQDMYYLQLNADPKQAVWRQATPAHIPKANSDAAMVWDSDDDVLFTYGYDIGSSTHNNWVYCPTDLNPVPGTLTPKQSAAGCAAADDWSEVTPVGGVQPPGVAFPGMVYDPVTKKAILYGGNNTALTLGYNQTWAYDIPTHVWVQKALSTTAPPPYVGSSVAQPAMAYDSKRKIILYHQTSNTGAPADWQYDQATDRWAKLTTTAAGAAVDQVLVYDSANDVFIGFNRDAASGLPQIWQGRITAAAPRGCDLNGNDVYDQADVQTAVQQSLGSCSTADINGDGLCNVIDIQRVINASLGKGCNTSR